MTNTGRRAGRDVVQLYVHQERSRVKQPIKKLIGFRNVDLAPGQTTTVRFTVKATDLAFWDVTRNKWAVERSPFDLMTGSSSADIASSATVGSTARSSRRGTWPSRRPRRTSTAIRARNWWTGPRPAGRPSAPPERASGSSSPASDLRAGPSTFTAQVAKGSPGAAPIQIRLGNPVSGPVIGTATVPSPADVYRYTTATAPLTGAHGIRDLYLVFTGPLEVSTFSFGR